MATNTSEIAKAVADEIERRETENNKPLSPSASIINNPDETSNMAKCPHCGFEFNVEFSCGRCGHKWIPRENREPKVCPSCKSPYWNKPRVREVAKATTKAKR
jgi:DNA-directed RNA polymerase subunit RPC12/RpoP